MIDNPFSIKTVKPFLSLCKMKIFNGLALFLLVPILTAISISGCTEDSVKAPKGESYLVDTIPTPEGLDAETGAIDFLPDGRLIAAFIRGEVMIYDPNSNTWSLFATGLHEPLGLQAVNNSEILAMQLPELTRIKDTDGDGKADSFENMTDAFGMTGNYHEFAYGPVRDHQNNLYIALNLASSGGTIRDEVRGKLDSTDRRNKTNMYSFVPYRGWVLKVDSLGNVSPFAMGFRSPDGLVTDSSGNLFVTDNQGDWVGTSPLYHVQEGKFYGHPASLHWKVDWNRGNPFKLPRKQLDSMRTKAAVLFPHNIMGNSITQPVFDNTGGKFGPFTGQMFVGDMNENKILRVILEKVGGIYQGACIPFIFGKGLRKGNHRLAFAPDGALWVGQINKGWMQGDKGIQRIKYTGAPVMDVLSMNLTKNGFDLHFTQPLNTDSASDPSKYSFRHYYYEYHDAYGSDQFDVRQVPVTKVSISEDRKKISVSLATLKPGYVYELKLGNIISEKGTPLANHLICYTLNNLLP